MAKAKFRMVNTSFWDDPRVVEELTPEDKYFFLYLLTNSNTTQIGIYQITKKQMSFDLGYSMESINSLLERFIKQHEIVRYNTETREIAIKNWGKYNLNRGGKPMLDCVTSELKEVKDQNFISYVGDQVQHGKIKAIYDTYTLRFEDKNAPVENGDVVENDQIEKKDDDHQDVNNSNDFYDTSTIRPQYKEKEEEEYKDKDRVRDLFDHFVSKKIIQHKKMTSAMKSAIKARLRDYTYNDLIKAIDNYALVYKSPNHWFTHKYPLADFMRDKDVRKFLGEADPVNNFASKKGSFVKNTKQIQKEDFDLT